MRRGDRQRRGWGLAALAAACALAAAPASGKITVYTWAARSPESPPAADDLTMETVAALDQLPGVDASSARPGAQAGQQYARLSAGEVGRRVAEATGAGQVIVGGFVRPPEAPQVLIATPALYDAHRGRLHLWDPVRVSLSARGGEAAATEAVAAYLAGAFRRWSAPSATVLDVQRDDAGVRVRLDLSGALPPSEGYVLRQLAAPLPSPRTDEQFAGQPTTLGLARLQRSAAGVSWFVLPPTVTAPGAGDTVQIVPVEDLRWGTESPGLVITSRPYGAVVSVNGQVYGTTPMRLPLPVDADVELTLAHPDMLPWRQRLGDAERIAGLVAVDLIPGQSTGGVEAEPRLEPRPLAPMSEGPAPVRGGGLLDDLLPPPANRPPAQPAAAAPEVGSVLWQRSLQLGRDGDARPATLQITVADLVEGGTLVSLATDPVQPFAAVQREGFAVDYPGLVCPGTWAWPQARSPQLAGLRVEPANGDRGTARVRLELPDGVVPRVHDSSSAGVLRVVLEQPAAFEWWEG